ncbi:hypothetical protein QNI16_21590 [Cytophagaceae bacterium YF14B1]|uniref:Uncharacterized protein n=1 Tax=Xanthocytophaga flava TaxID=3048013 RepID=A0AAE3U868_9BACT|nr:hypothetical protein [Xanthocytophaga flavus]MDJ1483106.1 hypothetical protein [Xanthocytophaga flavus]
MKAILESPRQLAINNLIFLTCLNQGLLRLLHEDSDKHIYADARGKRICHCLHTGFNTLV